MIFFILSGMESKAVCQANKSILKQIKEKLSPPAQDVEQPPIWFVNCVWESLFVCRALNNILTAIMTARRRQSSRKVLLRNS